MKRCKWWRLNLRGQLIDRKKFLTISLGLIALFMINLNSQGDSAMSLMTPGSVIKGFKIPRFNDKGEAIAQLSGESAKILDRERILIQNIRYATMEKNKPHFQFAAESGVFHRKAEVLTSKKRVQFSRDNLKINGTGMVWNLKNNQCRMNSNVVMLIQNMEQGLTQ